MRLSDVSVQRPVLAVVLAALIVAFGLLALQRLPLQEYPSIDPPVVGIDTRYPGASASVVETRITQVLEDRISGVSGIEVISSSSEDGRSSIRVEFALDMDIDAAANDIRDRISGSLDNLPEEADPPEVQKADSSSEVVIWLSLSGAGFSMAELTDYANRYLVDRFSVLPGVSQVRIGGGREYAMRVWLNADALAARGLTAGDVEDALRLENIELPGGAIESRERQFIVRLPRNFATPADFLSLVLAQGSDGYLVRLGDVARVEIGAVEERTLFRGNGIPMVGLGMIKQSTANVLEISKGVKAEMARVQNSLPEGMSLSLNFDSSVFVSGAIAQVVQTLFITMGLVVVAIFLFLGNLRTTLIPAVTVPIALIGTFAALAVMGFTLNLLTLLALVLAIGLIVDDAIVVLENIHQRMHDHGETSLVASFRGTRQIAPGGSRQLLGTGQWPAWRHLRLHARLHGRDRGAAAAHGRGRRDRARGGPRATRLGQYRELQQRLRDRQSGRLGQPSLGLGDHGSDSPDARRPARCARLPGDAPGLRVERREARAVRAGWRQL